MIPTAPPLIVPAEEDSRHLVARIRNVIGAVALDCDCRQRVNEALARFVEQEQQRQDRRSLQDARQMRASIAALVELLGELEDVSWREDDRSVFPELAHIFEDIQRLAEAGAAAMHMVSRQ